jgi:hypothetical protein
MIDPAAGFTLAISYGYCYTIAIASEVSAAAIIVVGTYISQYVMYRRLTSLVLLDGYYASLGNNPGFSAHLCDKYHECQIVR